MSVKRRRRNLLHATDGATALEFALVGPLLFVLILGLIQLGWVMHSAASVRWALEASSRALMIDPKLTATDVRTAMVTRLAGLADADELTISITPDDTAKTLLVESQFIAPLALPLMPVTSLTFRNSVTVPNFNSTGGASTS